MVPFYLGRTEQDFYLFLLLAHFQDYKLGSSSSFLESKKKFFLIIYHYELTDIKIFYIQFIAILMFIETQIAISLVIGNLFRLAPEFF